MNYYLMLAGGDGDNSDNNNNHADSIKNTDNGADRAHDDAPIAMMATIWIMLPCKSLELVTACACRVRGRQG